MILKCIIYALCILNSVSCVINNVCPSIEDYYTLKENPKCWYDFTADSNVTEVIIKHGYPVEVHKGVTPDGYILTIIRIPSSGVRGPVFIQHGLQASALNFVSKGKESIAFILADAGYDVWLGNFRGNEYSEEHVNMSTNDRKFWDYSIDEIGMYDIPTQLKVVSEKTGSNGNIIYIGHSLGTTVGLIYGSWFPEEAKRNVKLFILLAPAATLSNMISPLRLLSPLSNAIFNIISSNDLMKIASQSSILKNILRTICLESPLLMKRCTDIFNLFYGARSQTGPEMIPVQLNQFPGGSSIKLANHAANMALNFFGRYNYGKENFVKYGTITPPRYQVSKIQVPVFIVYSLGDWACTKKDALILYNGLSQQAKVYGTLEVAEKNFNHVDFLYAKRAKSLIYDHIMSLLDKLK